MMALGFIPSRIHIVAADEAAANDQAWLDPVPSFVVRQFATSSLEET